MTKRLPKGMMLFFALMVLVAIGNGFSDSIYANYFKEAYHVTAVQRGFLEFPRELPGVICVLVIAMFSGIGDMRLSFVAQILACFGLTVLGLTTPSFNVMTVFLFINSLGMHLFFPLQDSIGMSLSEPDQVGKRMGQYASLRSAVGLLCGVCVYLGFRFNVFSYVTAVKPVFLIGALGFLGATIAALLLVRTFQGEARGGGISRPKILFRKQYKYYYLLAILQGVQKQITYVYGSWVVIDILLKGTDVMSLLYIVSNFVCIFFMNMLGRWMDRFGIKRMMFINAYGLIFVYGVYGVIVLLLNYQWMPQNIWSVGIVYLMFIVDRISIQCSVIRAVYLRSIAWSGNDVTATLSTGTSLDHIVAIVSAPLCGLVWANWGPHWVFFIAAALSLVNVYVACKIRPEEEARDAERCRAGMTA